MIEYQCSSQDRVIFSYKPECHPISAQSINNWGAGR
jgi:hypothetical protein